MTADQDRDALLVEDAEGTGERVAVPGPEGRAHGLALDGNALVQLDDLFTQPVLQV
jgi:hypothetical protein